MECGNRKLILVGAFALGLSACAKTEAPAGGSAASASTTPANSSPVVPAEATPVSDEALAWMQGSWCGKDEDQVLEETWMMPAEGEAIGMSRTLAGGRMISFEFMRIANLDGTETLLAQPNGDAPVSFPRTDGGEGWIRFENKEHDYPQRIEYRESATGLHAEIGGPGAGDKEAVIAFEYTRCK
jgi:hypothetical protein